jgi:hypothetical protein
MSKASSKKTKDPKVIRAWVEERKGKPAHVIATGDEDDPGVLRIDFPGYSGEGTLEEIGWDEWFEKFEAEDLTFLYQDQTADGDTSRFCKIIYDGEEEE